MRRRISIRGRVRPSVRMSVPCYFRRWKVRILGASCAVYPALFSGKRWKEQDNETRLTSFPFLSTIQSWRSNGRSYPMTWEQKESSTTRYHHHAKRPGIWSGNSNTQSLFPLTQCLNRALGEKSWAFPPKDFSFGSLHSSAWRASHFKTSYWTKFKIVKHVNQRYSMHCSL